MPRPCHPSQTGHMDWIRQSPLIRKTISRCSPNGCISISEIGHTFHTHEYPINWDQRKMEWQKAHLISNRRDSPATPPCNPPFIHSRKYTLKICLEAKFRQAFFSWTLLQRRAWKLASLSLWHADDSIRFMTRRREWGGDYVRIYTNTCLWFYGLQRKKW